MDQIDLALLTLHFLARVQRLRESTQLFRSAPHMPHDTSCFELRESCVASGDSVNSGVRTPRPEIKFAARGKFDLCTRHQGARWDTMIFLTFHLCGVSRLVGLPARPSQRFADAL
jgi:hypothetical protein